MSGIRKWLLGIPLGLALTAGPAMAQRGHGGGPHGGAMHVGAPHVGAMHVGGVRPAGVYHGGFSGAHPYYGHYYHDHHNGNWAIGIGLGFGLGVPFYGGYYASPYPAGVVYPYDYAPYGIPTYPPLIPVNPATPTIPPAAPGNVEMIAPPAGAAPAPAATDKPTSATVSVKVPAGAELWFNGKKQEAGSGQFVSDPIAPGQSATLEVQAKWGGGTRSMRIPLQAGDKMTVDLTRP